MPTTHPRLNVVLEAPLYQTIRRLAKRNGLSMSLEARELLREAVELYEDAYWAEKAQARVRTVPLTRALTHEQVWGRRRL